MIRPMMVITTSISTSVKPRSPSRSGLVRSWRDAVLPAASRPNLRKMAFMSINSYILSPYQLRHRKQCSHYRDDQASDHDADRQDRDGPGNPHGTIEAALQLGLVELCDPARQHR